jgi:hypothetical protein
MATDDDVADTQTVNRELNSRSRSRGSRMPVWWHEVSNIAEDEQIAGIRRSKDVYCHATVRASDEESIGLLAQGQPLECLNQAVSLSFTKLNDAPDEFVHFRKRPTRRHKRCFV